TCAWPAGTVFTFEQGDALGAPSAVEVAATDPGQEAVIEVALQAPQAAGSAAHTWGLRLADGTAIGDPLGFGYTFVAPTATATRPPTRSPTRPPVGATTPAPPTRPPSTGPITVRRVNFVSAVRTGGNNANAT